MTERQYVDEEVNVPEALLRVLEEAGINTVFGMPGGYTMQLFDALHDHRDTIRTVLVRDESLAGVMAEVYGRLTGRPGVVIGQGAFLLSNALMGTLEAYLGSSPMLLLTEFTDQFPFSHHAPYQAGSGEYGTWDAKTAFGAVTKWSAIAREPGAAIQLTQLAIKHAITGDRGPVGILFHSEALNATVSSETLPRIYPLDRYLTNAPRPVEDEEIRRAARALVEAARPVIVAGNGVRLAAAYSELQELAALLGAPVATTAGGKGTFAETDPLALGVFGNFGLPLANAVVGEADLVLAVGTKLAPSDTAYENPDLLDPERQTLIQLDDDPLNVSWTFPADHKLVGDAARGLAQLADAVRECGVNEAARATRLARLEELREQHGWFDVPESSSDSVPITPQRVIKALASALPQNAIVASDAGENRLFMMHYFQTKAPGTYLQPASTGGMGYAIPAAMSAQLVHPERRAVAVCSDGGFAMSMNGLMTAREERLPIIVVLLCNQTLGWVRHQQGDRPIASEFDDFNHAAIAHAMGCRGIRVEAPEDLDQALSEAVEAEDCPTVVEVITTNAETYRKVSSPLLGAVPSGAYE